MKSPQTLLGHVVAVSGASVSVHLVESVASGLAVIDGSTYRVGQVGSFIRIPLGYQDLFGVVSQVGVSAAPESLQVSLEASARWMKVQLVGEAIGTSFERGISQHPNVNDEVHLVTEQDLIRIYGETGIDQVHIGRLSSAENIYVRIDIDKLLTRHCAVLGSTGSGKSTTIASLLRAIAASSSDTPLFPSARILLLDIHGEYSDALSDISTVFRINPNKGQNELFIPYWAIDPSDLISFLTGGIVDDKAMHLYDKITELKQKALSKKKYPGVDKKSLTVDTPIPYSLNRLWLELIDAELRTFEGPDRDQPALVTEGDARTLTPIYTIQKRMLRIGESKALGKDVKKNRKYGKPPKPFCVVSTGAYDFSRIMKLRENKDAYIDFVLGLFQSSRDEKDLSGKYRLTNIFGEKEGDPVEVYPVWNNEYLKNIRIDEKYLKGIILQSRGKLKGNYYIITPETCTMIGDTTMKNSAGNDVHFKMLKFPYKILEDVSRNFQIQQQPSSQENVNNLINSTGFYFNDDVEIEVEKTKHGLKITRFETKILDNQGDRLKGLDGLAMLLVDIDYDGKIFDMDRTVFAKDISDDGKIRMTGLTESIAVVAIDKHGNESKPFIV